MQLAFATLLICAWAVSGSAQGSQKSSLIRVGTIKNYPATGLMTGCGNLYFYKAAPAKSTGDNYVFLARDDGSNAWMNLNGRDVRLQQIKRRVSANQKSHPLFYRYGEWQIEVVMEDFKPGVAAGESDPMFQMKITVRRRSAMRVVRAVGDSDC